MNPPLKRSFSRLNIPIAWLKLLPKTGRDLCLGPYQKKNQIWKNSKQENKSHFSIPVLWHKDPWVLPLLCIAQKIDPDWWPIISLFVYSCPTFALYSNSFCLTSNYISEPSPKRTPQKPFWDSIFKQNPHSGTLTTNRVFIFEQNPFQKYLQDDCDPSEAPLLSLGAVAAWRVWHWALQQSPNWDFLFDPRAAELTEKVAALQGDIQTSRQVPQQSQGQLFLPHTVTISWKCQRPKVTAVPWQYLYAWKVPGCPCVSQCYCSYVKPRICLFKTRDVFSPLYMSHTCSAS